MEFKKHCAVPSKGAIMGIMGLAIFEFSIDFSMRFLPVHLIQEQVILCFTWSQGYAAEVFYLNRAYASQPLNAQKRLFNGRLFHHTESHKPFVQHPLKMNRSITLVHLSQLVLVGI